MNDFGDFKEIEEQPKNEKKNGETEQTKQQYIPSKIKLPRGNQLIGVVIERLGGKRMSVKATDMKIRNCRVPGRFKRAFWLRPGQTVLIEPWPDRNEFADIVYQYRSNEVQQLKKRGFLSGLSKEF